VRLSMATVATTRAWTVKATERGVSPSNITLNRSTDTRYARRARLSRQLCSIRKGESFLHMLLLAHILVRCTPNVYGWIRSMSR